MAGKPTPTGWVMGTPVGQPSNYNAATGVPVGNPHAVPNPYVIGPQEAYYTGTTSTSNGDVTGNPYVHVSSQPGSSNNSPMDTVLKALGKCGKKLETHTKKASGVTANVWQHRMSIYALFFLGNKGNLVKTSPNMTSAAMSKLALGTKLIAEGGRDKIFHQTFGTLPGEQLKKTYACYLSTSSGPVIGTLYLSNARIAFCSDNPLSSNPSPNSQPQLMYYKIVVPLDRMRAVNPSANAMNPSDRYIQVVTADNHEFWFMGFVNYDKALRNLTEALHYSNPFYAPGPVS